MCGISGIRRYGATPISEIQIRMLLTGMEHRGNDATGIAMQKKSGQIVILKDDKPAWDFVRGDKYEEFLNENLNDEITQVILHTRAATKGNPRRFKNNHPLFSGKAAVVHNGVLHNDDELFRTFDLDRTADTDSDILRAIVDKWGITPEAIQKANKIRGGAAFAALHPEYPGKLLLARSGNPLTTGSTPEFFFFASEKQTIHRAARPWVERFKRWFQVQSVDLAFSPFPDDTAQIFGDDGFEFHDQFKIYLGVYREPIRRVYSDYSERQRNWTQAAGTGSSTSGTKGSTTSLFFPLSKIESEKSDKSDKSEKSSRQFRTLVKCPACQKELGLKPEQIKIPLYDLFCPKDGGGCGSRLGEYQSSKLN